MTTITGGNTTGLYDANAISISNDINANTIFANQVTVSGNITANNITAGNNVTVGNAVTTDSIFTDNYYYANGAPFSGGGGDYGNANVAAYLPTNTANVSAGNIAVTGEISAVGNITGAFILGNGSQLTGISGTYSNADVQAYLPTYSGDLNPGTVSASGNIVAAGNVGGTYLLGDGQFITNLPGGSYGNANVANYLPVYSGAITSISELSATGNVTGGNLITTGALEAASAAVTGNITTGNILTDGYYYANGAPFVSSDYGDANVAAYLPTYTGNLASMEGIITTLANITGGNILSSGLLSAAGTIVTTGNVEGGNADITNAVTATTLSASGNITGGNISVSGAAAAATLTTTGNVLVGGNLFVNGNTTQINIENLNVQDPIIGLGRGANNEPLTTNDGKDRGEQLWYYSGSEKSAFVGYDNSAGNIIAATDVSITDEIVTVNNYGTFEAGDILATTLSTTGNVDALNFSASADVYAGAFIGGQLDITGNAAVGGDVNAATFTGSGAGLTGLARGNDSTIQYNVGGDGGDTAGNDNLTWNESTNTLAVVGTFDLTGDMLMGPGNIDLTGQLIVSGDISMPSGNIDLQTGELVMNNTLSLTGDLVMAAGNIDLQTGDIVVGGQIQGGELSLSGNVQTVDVIASGAITATGNIQGDYFIGNGSLLTGVTASGVDLADYTGNIGNVSVGVTNLNVDPILGNIYMGAVRLTEANNRLFSATGIDVNGPVTATNVTGSGLIAMTGNITGGNIISNANVFMGASSTLHLGSVNLTNTSGSPPGLTIYGSVGANGAVTTTTTMSATGNITSGDTVLAQSGRFGGSSQIILAGNDGNIATGNISVAGIATVTGNITGGNVTTAGRAVAKNYTETAYSVGTVNGTLSLDISNGSIQYLTANGNITINSISNIVNGQSMLLVITQDATGSRTLSSTWKFAGNARTLSTAANAVDVISVVYSNSTYYASLTLGYA